MMIMCFFKTYWFPELNENSMFMIYLLTTEASFWCPGFSITAVTSMCGSSESCSLTISCIVARHWEALPCWRWTPLTSQWWTGAVSSAIQVFEIHASGGNTKTSDFWQSHGDIRLNWDTVLDTTTRRYLPWGLLAFCAWRSYVCGKLSSVVDFSPVLQGWNTGFVDINNCVQRAIILSLLWQWDAHLSRETWRHFAVCGT